MSKCTLCGVEITGEHVQWPVSGPAHMNKAACFDALRASLAAAEAKLADERKHADWLAKQYRECSVWPSTEEQHAGCECGWMWGYMEHGDFEQEEQHAPECPNAVHAARRAADATLSDAGASSEVGNG